jgi:putative membrane protein
MFSQVLANYSGNYDMMDGGSWGWGWVMMIFWIVAIVFVVSLIARSVGWGRNTGGRNNDDALEIAKKRFASGEINKKEFDEIRKDLQD